MKQCIIHVHGNKELALQVQELAYADGFRWGGGRKGIYLEEEAYHFKFGETITHAVSEFFHSHITFKALLHLDADTQMDEIRKFFGAEPEMVYDETPLPTNTMTPEQAKETQVKFNLSPEQWETLSPRVREALSGAVVTVVKTEHKWIPVSEPPRGSFSVLFTDSPIMALDSCSHCDVGYFSGGEPSPLHGITPTHWCHMPGDQVTKEEDDAEQESEPEW